RMEKHGDMLTMSVGNIEENEFKPYFQKSILNLKTAAPFFARQNCSVFISTQSASIQGIRFLVNGLPPETRLAKVKPAPPKPTPPAAPAPAATASNVTPGHAAP